MQAKNKCSVRSCCCRCWILQFRCPRCVQASIVLDQLNSRRTYHRYRELNCSQSRRIECDLAGAVTEYLVRPGDRGSHSTHARVVGSCDPFRAVCRKYTHLAIGNDGCAVHQRYPTKLINVGPFEAAVRKMAGHMIQDRRSTTTASCGDKRKHSQRKAKGRHTSKSPQGATPSGSVTRVYSGF